VSQECLEGCNNVGADTHTQTHAHTYTPSRAQSEGDVDCIATRQTAHCDVNTNGGSRIQYSQLYCIDSDSEAADIYTPGWPGLNHGCSTQNKIELIIVLWVVLTFNLDVVCVCVCACVCVRVRVCVYVCVCVCV